MNFLDDHVNDIADVLEGFFASSAPRRAACLRERRTVGVPARRIPIEILVGFQNYFEVVGLHTHIGNGFATEVRFFIWDGE